MGNASSRVDVLVVGAGPVGLTLACELYRHGVPCRIVDKNAGPVAESRATDIQPRTLEVFYDMGVLDDVFANGVRQHGVQIFADRKPLARASFDLLDTPWPCIVGIAQSDTERLLERHLAKFGGEVERNVELARIEDGVQGVTATLLSENGSWEKVQASWLVACDGANSTVRRAHNLPFDGLSYEESFLLADVHLDWDIPNDQLVGCYGEHGTMLALPLPGERNMRLFFNEPEKIPCELSLASFQKLFDLFAPIPGRLDRGGWMSRFRIHKRIVPKYRVGRSLLAGDAAHIHSPVNGQGLNLGVQDAYNLAWKLSLVVRGHARESLIDSYEPERRPLALDVLQSSDQNTRAALVKSRFAQAIRNQAMGLLMRLPALARRVMEHDAELAWNYRASPIVGQHCSSLFDANVNSVRTTEAPTIRDRMDFSSAPAAGDRVPDVRFGGTSLFEMLRGTKHALLLFDGSAPTRAGYENLARVASRVRERWGDRIAAHLVVLGASPPPDFRYDGHTVLDADGALHARMGAGAECLYLVRPDGYVGFRSQPAEEKPLMDHLGSILV